MVENSLPEAVLAAVAFCGVRWLMISTGTGMPSEADRLPERGKRV
jgi:hypothetical protein